MKTNYANNLGCLGYFGFGSGWAAQGRVEMNRPLKGEAYCNADKCGLAERCWDLHRARVRKLFPAAVAYVDEMVAEGKTGPEIVAFFTDHRVPDPYMAVMFANMDAGMFRRRGKDDVPQNDRGPLTLRDWPLKPCDWDPEVIPKVILEQLKGKADDDA